MDRSKTRILLANIQMAVRVSRFSPTSHVHQFPCHVSNLTILISKRSIIYYLMPKLQQTLVKAVLLIQPSCRSLVFKFFKFSCRLASSRISAFGSQSLFTLRSLKPCMHVRFRGCVGNLVIPYYSTDYLYSILQPDMHYDRLY